MTEKNPDRRYLALLPAAGVGARMAAGCPKQYLTVAGQPMLRHAVAAFCASPLISHTYVVVSAEDGYIDEVLPAGLAGVTVLRCGGDTRQASVTNGLRAMADRVDPDDWVLVHDAARCLIRPEWIRQLLAQCHDDEVGGLLALPLPDTLKASVPGQACVAATLPRQDKWLAQTPQMFRWGLLRLALQDLDEQITDEASAVERLGHQPRLVPCSIENFKVTYPQDFLLAERLLATR